MMRRYPAYRESGVDWLGEVPEGWGVVAVKRVAFLQSGNTITAERIEEMGEYPVFGGNGLRGYTDQFTHVGEYALIGRQGALCGNINYGIGQFWASEHAIVVHQRSLFVTRWLGEVLRAMNLGQYSTSAAQPGVAVEVINELRIPLPPLAEQTAIAAFLDRETGKIDALVAEQRRLIDLLREKRQATISHAVTRGLNPAAPLKPSGVDWLGDVPEGWEVVPLKYLANFSSGGTPSKERLDYWEGEVPWASARDLKAEVLHDTGLHLSDEAISAGAVSLQPAGSVLVLVRGMTLAKAFPVCVAGVDMAINQDLKALRPSDKMTSDFLAWVLRGTADESLSRIDEAGHGTKALRMEAWISMELPVPPFDEQSAIVAFLAERTAQLDSLITTAESAISLLLERRAALISAAVTGKIDVRSQAVLESALA